MEGLYRPIKKDLSRLAQTCAEAFIDYPLHAYAVPERTEREKLLPSYFKVMVRYGFKFGDMYATSENLEGVAIYIHPESGPITTWRWVQCGMLGFMHECGSAAMKRYNQAIAPIEMLKKKHAPPPFTYLGYLAVEPRSQNRGYASKLVKPMLDHLAEKKMACYLETFKPKNEEFYNRLGFKTVEKFPLPGTDLTVISLLWQPSEK
nr:GNAT family N-acetyltransferase [Candidatus Sigynarchaeota archaeon]